MRTTRRVLVVRQDRLGDLLLTTPIATALKKAIPDCHITFMIRPHLHEVVENNPNIDAIWHTAYRPPVSEWLHWMGKMRRARLDAIILCKPDSGAHTWIATLARIPIRAGSTRKYYARFLTHNLLFDFHSPPMHEVELITTMAQCLTSTPCSLNGCTCRSCHTMNNRRQNCSGHMEYVTQNRSSASIRALEAVHTPSTPNAMDRSRVH